MLAALYLLVYAFQFTEANTGDILLESHFLRDADGWFVTVEGGKTKAATSMPVDFDRISKKIKSGDQGDVTWYFTAPNKYHGDKSSLYHGIMEFGLVCIYLCAHETLVFY